MASIRRFKTMPARPQELPPKPKPTQTPWYRSILYGTTSSTGSAEDEKRHPRSDTMCAIFLVLLVLGTTATVLYFQLHNWPQQTSSYTTNDPLDTFRGGLVYTCGCSLPPNLQSAKNPEEKNPLKACHDPSELETVTVLMFSDSIVESLILGILEDYSSTRPLVSKIVNDGFGVTQEAHDLTRQPLSSPERALQLDELLLPLYLHGVNQPNTYPTVEYLRSSAFLHFPDAYMRMAWMYDCNNCTTCGLDQVNGLSVGGGPINQSAWVSCFYYGGEAERCSTNNSYTAKCVLYPTEELPAVFAVQGFLNAFTNFIDISNIRDVDYHSYQDVRLDSGIRYLNISNAESRPIKLSFVEVEKGSVIWAMLAGNFPALDECTNLSPVLVCNSTSICNVYESASTYDSGCIHFTNHSQCADLANYGPYGAFSPDNVDYLQKEGEQLVDIVCPKLINCVTSSPHLVIWNTSAQMETDPLNYFLRSRILFGEWAQRSGVCINTYENVLRYDQQPNVEGVGTSANEKVTMFLQSNCTNSTPTQPSYCWLSGSYHNLTDDPGADWTLLPDDLFRANGDRFECYRVEGQEFMGWFINTVGVLFGWIGTTQLVFYAAFYWFFVPARRFLLDRPTGSATQNGDKLLLLDSLAERSHGNGGSGELQMAAM